MNVPQLVRILVSDAPRAVAWLEGLGLLFDRFEDGNIETHMPAGHSRPRSHSCRDMTGLEIMRVLRDEMRNKQIPVLEFSPVVELLTDRNGACLGAVLLNLDTNKFMFVQAKKTILATGSIAVFTSRISRPPTTMEPPRTELWSPIVPVRGCSTRTRFNTTRPGSYGRSKCWDF